MFYRGIVLFYTTFSIFLCKRFQNEFYFVGYCIFFGAIMNFS